MTVQSDLNLRALLRSGDLVVDPLLDEREQVKGAKIDVRLDNKFCVLRSEQSQAWDFQTGGQDVVKHYERVDIGYAGKFILHPGNFVIGQTFETIRIPKEMLGRIEGRSSLARRGVLIHVTASVIDPGFAGNICLELYNLGHVPVILNPLMRVGALTIERVDGEVKNEYSGSGQFAGDAIDAGLRQKPDRDFLRIAECIRSI